MAEDVSKEVTAAEDARDVYTGMISDIADRRLARFAADWRAAFPKRSIRIAMAHGMWIGWLDGRHVEFIDYLDGARPSITVLGIAPFSPMRKFEGGRMARLIADALNDCDAILGNVIEANEIDVPADGK